MRQHGACMSFEEALLLGNHKKIPIITRIPEDMRTFPFLHMNTSISDTTTTSSLRPPPSLPHRRLLGFPTARWHHRQLVSPAVGIHQRLPWCNLHGSWMCHAGVTQTRLHSQGLVKPRNRRYTQRHSSRMSRGAVLSAQLLSAGVLSG